jgi:hypothetical protein
VTHPTVSGHKSERKQLARKRKDEAVGRENRYETLSINYDEEEREERARHEENKGVPRISP